MCNYIRMNADTNVCTLDVDGEYVELAVEIFAMLADATRIRIILALRDTELPVNQLAERVNKSQAAVSQHLAKLRMARIVTTRRDGTRVFYRLANEHARQLVADAIFQAEHALDAIPAHHRHPHDVRNAESDPGAHA
ncbi:MAG: ArsR family transcriptional regulator [Cryobacterium sp.]|nr:ArsR family transcriptional regulator [Cryobacterium sp.]